MDVLTYAPGRFHLAYEWTYLLLVRRFSWLWRFGYAWLDSLVGYRLLQPLRWRWNLLIARRFMDTVKANPPDVIAATHFLPADAFSTAKRQGWLASRLIVVVTDLHSHRFWISREAEAMVVSTPEGRATLERRGVDPERIHTIGIPVGEAFEQPIDRPAARQRYGIEPDRLAVLVTSGGTTVGQFERVVHSLLGLERQHPGQMHLLVVCGMDDAAKARLTEAARRASMPMRVFGFVSFMADLMGASDVMVAKAGGLTVSEALARGLPMILYHVIPGQERMNAEHAARAGAAVIALRPAYVARAVLECLKDRARLDRMREAARTLTHPHAAQEIIDKVMEPFLSRNA